MSTYYAQNRKTKFRINSIEMPEYVRQFLNSLGSSEGKSEYTVYNYFLNIQTFMRWLVWREQTHDYDKEYPDMSEKGKALQMRRDYAGISIKDISIEDIGAVVPFEIEQFMTFCRNELGNTNTTRSNKMEALRSFYSWLTRIYGISNNPVAELKSPKKENPNIKFMNDEEAVQLLEAAHCGVSPCRNYCIISFFLHCGMRLNELIQLDKDDINGRRLEIKRGKGAKGRILYLNDDCIEALTEYLSEREDYGELKDKDALFVNPRTGKRLTSRGVQKMVEKALREAGLGSRGFSPHKLRHTAATLMYSHGAAGVMEIKSILGHEGLDMCKRYVHVTDEQVYRSMTGFSIGEAVRKDV